MTVQDLRVFRHRWTKIVISVLLVIALFSGLSFSKTVHRPVQIASISAVHGVNVDITAIMPGTPYTVTTPNGGNFFDLAAQLGINTLRITDVQWEITGQERSQATWDYVFAEAEQHHMHIILLLIGGGNHSALDKAHTLLDSYGLVHAPALWLIDLNNEPDVSNPQQMAELREEAAYVHQIAPELPVTIGGWKSKVSGHVEKFNWQNPVDIPKFINLVNIVSPHLYEFNRGAQLGFTPQQWTLRFLNAVRQRAQGKPILLEEFGASNGLAATNDFMPPASSDWQASVYRGVLQEILAERHRGVLGAVAWIMAPRPAFPHNVEGDMTGWALVLNNGRHLLPAAQVFSTARN